MGSKTKDTASRSLNRDSKASVIGAVQTPLGFFVLIVLILEVVLGSLSAVTTGPDRTYLIIGMLALMLVLILTVTAMAMYRPEALYGKLARSRNSSPKPIDAELMQRLKKPTVFWGDGIGIGEMDRQLEIDVIHGALPSAEITVNAKLTAQELREALATRSFDIVLLSGNVAPDGSVAFRRGDGTDTISADGLAKLLDRSRTKLVILACCNSVPMAARLAPVTNMIAATQNLPVLAFQDWHQLFFRLLGQGVPVSEAYNIAAASVDAPLAMLLKRDFTIE
jgi:hypothetical protein